MENPPKKLKLLSAVIFFFFLPSGSTSKTYTQNVFLFHQKSFFNSPNIKIIVIFFLPFHTFQIKKDES